MTTLLPSASIGAIDYLQADAPRILIVDDEPLVRALMLIVFDLEGFDAVAACDAPEAIERLDEQSFDLILLDICMPGPVDGEGLLFALRDRGEDVPIIIVSGWVDVEQRTPECVQAVLKKPFRMDALLDQVRMALQPV
jgi:DNA-binding NtrC family response regulator